MNLQMSEYSDGRVLSVRSKNKLRKEDYELLLQTVEQLIGQHGRIRVLFEMNVFPAWETDCAYSERGLDLKLLANVERLAVVGDRPWEEWSSMHKFCMPFPLAKVCYFDRSEDEESRAWIHEGLPATIEQ